MKNILNRTILTGLLALATATSCKKLLEQKPVNNPLEKNFWKTGQDAYTALGGAYGLFRSAMISSHTYFMFGDGRSGLYYTQPTRYQATPNERAYYILNNQLNDSRAGLRSWGAYYRIIEQCNLIIKNVPNIPIERFNTVDVTREEAIGEAFFLRAYTYFFMTRIWGDIPLNKTVENLDPLPRTASIDVLKSCLADADSAVAKLKYGYNNTRWRAIRANKGAAQMLKADILMWMDKNNASPTTLTEQALTALDELIRQNGNTLMAGDSASLAKIYFGKSPEGIFEIDMDKAYNEQSSGGPAMLFPLDRTINPSGATMILMEDSLLTLYPDPADVRRKLLKTGTVSGWATTDPLRLKKWYGSIKYANKASEVRTCSICPVTPFYEDNIIIYRLAGAILLKAEAEARLGRFGDARTDLGLVKTRAKAGAFTGTDAELTGAIQRERLAELLHEGHSSYDLIRWGMISAYNPRITDVMVAAGALWWPVDQGAFTNNPYMEQQAYWLGKL